MTDLELVDQKQWAVRVEKSAWGKGVISSELVATNLDYVSAWVKMREIENNLMGEGWYRGAWTLKHPDKEEIIMVSVKWNGLTDQGEIPF